MAKNLFYRQYELLKDLPTLPAGSVLKWNCWSESFTDLGDFIGMNPPPVKANFTLEQIESKPDWFKGVGKEVEYYPKFPSLHEFFDKSDGHCYLGETRHNNMCRTCQLINKLDIEAAEKEAVYNVYKTAYDKKFSPK